MKLLVFVFVLSLSVVCYVKATTFEDLVREQLKDLILNAEENTSEEIQTKSRRDKSYLTAQKHPERLRNCIKCVGVHREKGMNVKQATSYCNKTCKREIFDTRQLYERDFDDEDNFFDLK